MKTIMLIVLFGVTILFSPKVFTFSNTLDCKLTMSSIAGGQANSREFKYDTGPDVSEITFSDINSKIPILVGNGGSAKLIKIDNGDIIYFIETTEVGNLVVYTYFKKTQQILITKQYLYTIPISGVQLPFGMISSGNCQYR